MKTETGQLAENPLVGSEDMFFAVLEDMVKPAMVIEYEAAVKEFAEVSQERTLPYDFFVYFMSDFCYTVISAMENGFAGLEDVGTRMDDTVKAMGPELFVPLYKRISATFEYQNTCVDFRDSSLSYVPADMVSAAADMPFVHWAFYYVQYGKGAEAQDVIKELVALNQSKSTPQGFIFHSRLRGAELPLFIKTTFAKDTADYETQRAETLEILGDEGQSLTHGLYNTLRRYEEKTGWARPDLSYYPL